VILHRSNRWRAEKACAAWKRVFALAVQTPRVLVAGVALLGVVHLTAPQAWAQSGLVAAYSFDEGSGSAVKDSSSSGNNGTVKNATWTKSGRYGGALVFDGSSAVVNVSSSSSLNVTTAMTLEAWVRPSSVGSEWRDVIYKGDDNYYLSATSDHRGPAAGGTFTSTNAYGPSALAANTWTHLAATYDGSALKLYVNGSLVSSVAKSGRIATSGNPLQIGGDNFYGQYFAGMIDEVRVYNTALSAAQVQSDMNSPIASSAPVPAPAPSPADLTLTKTHSGSFTQGQNGAAYTLTARNAGAGPTAGTVTIVDTLPSGLAAAAISGSGWTCSVSPLRCTRTDALSAGSSYPAITVTVNVSSSAPSSVTNTATVSGGGETNTGNDSASDVTAIASVVSTPTPTPTPTHDLGLVAEYGFEEGSGSGVDDSSGHGNDGSIGNAKWTGSGRYGGALTFDGSSAVVSIASSSSLRLTTAMTLEAWVKPTSVSSQWRDVIYKGNDNYYLEGTSNQSGHPATGGSFASDTVYGPSTIAVNAWTHLAATYDGSTMKLYVSGSLVPGAARSGRIATSNNALQIGGDSFYGQYFAGAIDEVRVYDVALSAAQIQSDMNTPVGGATAAALPSPAAPVPTLPIADTTAPLATITAPAAGASVSGVVAVTATASDDTAVTAVAILVDGAVIGSDGTAPYTINWDTSAFGAGAHTLKAQARDAAGNVGTSSPVVVNIAAAPATATVSILAPVDGGVVNAPATVAVTAAVTDPNRMVARVNFYAGPTLIGSATSAPFTVNWSATDAGVYPLIVTAIDKSGVALSSTSVTVTV